MAHGVHAKDQTAFRFPPGVLPRLKAQAEAEGRTMTDIVVSLVTGYLDGITTSATPAKPVSPPRARRAREDPTPVVTFVAAEEPQPASCPHPKARINKGLCGACGTHVGKPSTGGT